MIDPVVLVLLALGTVGGFAVAGLVLTRGQVRNVEDFITARNSMGLHTATATFIATVMGSWILFSPAEAGVLWGFPAILGYGIGSAIPLVIYYFIGPRVRRLAPKGHSVTELSLARYGPGMYALVLFVTLFYMFIFLAAELTAISLVFNLLTGIPFYVPALLVGLATVAYTAYGGIRASVLTDSLQTLVILPLMAVAFLGATLALGGPEVIYGRIVSTTPDLLRFDSLPGIYFALFVAIAITGANVFNQGYWQRFYTSRNERVLRRGLAVAAFAVIPMVVLAGLFGIVSAGYGLADVPSAAFFSLVVATFPAWVVLVLFVLVLALIMSTMDSLLNGVASIFAADLPRLGLRMPSRRLLAVARVVTLLLALAAIAIASFGFSVLLLFLVADLVCAAAAFPTLYGLYSGRIEGSAAAAAGVAGIVVGAPLFVLGLVASGPDVATFFLMSFASALGVSVLLTLLLPSRRERYDLRRLAEDIGEIGD
ncbi:MAG: sodium:proline symporter [Thermoplasmata archaeon]